MTGRITMTDGRLIDAITQVHNAWIVQGPRPDYHRQAQIKLGRDWPRLAQALDHLAETMWRLGQEAEDAAADMKKLLDLIGDTPVRFWQCPDHPDGGNLVEWDTDTAACVTCGRTNKDES